MAATLAPTTKLTIFVVGPQRTGKSAVANCIAELSDSLNSTEYHPTQGVRILEFDRKVSIDSKRPSYRSKEVVVSVELWDCGGDPRFYPSWPAVASSAHALLIVTPSDGKQEKELELWHGMFKFLKDPQVLIFAHRLTGEGNTQRDQTKLKLGGTSLGSVQVVSTGMDEVDVIRGEFDRLVVQAYVAWMEQRDREEQSMIGD
ncbi:hypothetical protein BJ742DRAFT_822325 [Cladochytrium replicatum]|nr:hypothetical protein BJ742DRAFT_822325 [Cladochytrium replicatum]